MIGEIKIYWMQVLISRGVQKLPDGLVLKRWTKKARLVLPGHMDHLSRVDPDLRAQTHRHTTIMVSLLAFAEMADKNVEAYRIGMQILEEGKLAMAAAGGEADGLGLADKYAAKDGVGTVDTADPFPLRAPISRRGVGRPTNKRAKAGHETNHDACSKRPRYCSICQSEKHNRLKCPDRVSAMDGDKRPSTCSKCGLEGHRSTNCGKGADEVAVALAEFV
jgi:hypothetical protein